MHLRAAASSGPGIGRILQLIALVVVGWASVAPISPAQELSCRVQLDYSQISGTDTSVLDDLEDRIEAYLNTRSWTPHRVADSERIGCSLQVIIEDEPSAGDYEARLVVSARRPIFRTAQSSPVLRLNDPKWEFSYSRGESLVHNLNRYDPLASVLDFYAFLILGMDFDTFGERGGTAYLEQSRAIAERARSDPSSTGWESFGSDRSRADFIDELLDSQHRPLRDIMFRYHYDVLDHFVDDPEGAREEAMAVLSDLETLEDRVGSTYVLDHFFSSKFEELAALFRGSSVRQQARRTLTQLDPSHSSTYNNALE
ncbi:MAG: DUF4835 family protein [Longimonas sp.]|uniref:type IX secretion system protein PorD n=1 Tax=Longimonas sp. TaxID=2039626 RepID=UPI003974F91B